MLTSAVFAALAALPLALAQSASVGIPLFFNSTGDAPDRVGVRPNTAPGVTISGVAAAPTGLVQVIAASPSTSQVSSSATRCTTRYGFYPLPTGTDGVPTWYSFEKTTSTFSVTLTRHDTTTSTPDSTTFTNVLSTTISVTTTVQVTPSATTIPTSAGFLPLLVVNLAAPTPIARVKRLEIEGRSDAVWHPAKRQTAPGNTGGYIAYSNGTYDNLYRRFPHRVDCRVALSVAETVTDTVLGDPVTVIAAPGVATVASTVTILTTTTVTQVAPTPTIYAACQGNNVVNQVIDRDGNRLVFDRFIIRAPAGLPIANELVVNTTSAVNCCIACQNTPNCAGSFYAPLATECHLRLTQPFTPVVPSLPSGTASASGLPGVFRLPANGTFPTGTGRPVSAFPISTAVPVANNNTGTCADGSLSLFIGTIRGQRNFPLDIALSFSNGPCGRFAVSAIPVPVQANRPVKRAIGPS